MSRKDVSIQFIDLKAQQAQLGDKVSKAIENVLEHGKYIMGPEVHDLEAQLSNFCKAKHVISCASGTDALLMALMAFDVGPGDAVFVPSFTFVSTAEVVALLGATPIFVDVDKDSFLMDLDSLRLAIDTVGKMDLSLKGVIPVDLFGFPAAYKAINDIAHANNMFVVGDAAQSFGASIAGEYVGTLTDVTTTSFFPAKPLGCYGDGGAIFTDDDKIADKLRSIRVHGKGNDKYDNVNIGINGRLDTLQAAILIEKLSIFATEIEMRNKVAAVYTSELSDYADIPQKPESCTPAWAQYTLKVSNRYKIIERMKEDGVPTAIYYPKPLHLQTAYNNYTPVCGLGVSESLSDSVLSLPMHPYLDRDMQAIIINSYKKALEN